MPIYPEEPASPFTGNFIDNFPGLDREGDPIKLPEVIESYDTDEWEVMTDTGWADVEEVHKTVPYKVYSIHLENGMHIECADLHRMYGEDLENPIYAMDLKVGDRLQTENGLSAIKRIEILDIGEQNMYDLTLGDENHRFYANGILSHNSTNQGIRCNLCCNTIPGLKIATIVPRTEQLKTIADKYSEISQAFRFKRVNSKFRDNLYYKEFPHPSGQLSVMRLWYILSNADKIRGNTYDWLDFDEYQDFDDGLETVIRQTQARSNLRSVSYSGTSKTTDTALEERWLESSRGVWRLTCPACRFDNYPNIKNGVLDMIQAKGLCCKKCGHLLNVRDGCWDFEAPEMMRLGRWGFHVPQIIVPANTENKAIWIDIFRKSRENDLKSFFEEYLGEATEEGAKEITVKDLQEICTLGSFAQVQKGALNRQNPAYRILVSGVDWGGSDYNPADKTKASFTVHTILGVRPDGQQDIVSIQKYAGMDYDSISEAIAKQHKAFNCYALGCDFGGGAVYVNELKKLIDPLKVVSFKYSTPKSAILGIPKSSLNYGNLYSLNRTESITSLYKDIKDKRIRAPMWEQSQEFLKECLNLVRIPVEESSGENTLLYRKRGNKTDDFLHSLNYAVILAKLVMGQQLFEDATKQAMFHNYMRYGSFNVPSVARKFVPAVSG